MNYDTATWNHIRHEAIAYTATKVIDTKYSGPKVMYKLKSSLPTNFWGISEITILKVKPFHTAGLDTIFFSYLLTREVNFFEVLDIMAQMWHYINFLSYKVKTLFWII